CMQPLEFPYSF
nr:immunoglobulin light chain junction region [Macaca mulatta]MOX25794.1 immunoglobulin light chain junction region [Macaca mulatta]MOX26818.1 immunoglobulin light chain junction region [Macaca mulatta]